MRITLGEARQQLYTAIVPSLDSQASVDRFNSYLNLAQERLINSGKWNGTIFPVRFVSPDGTITLPRRYISALAAKWVKDEASGPIKIRNGWFSYLTPITDLWSASYWPRYGFNETFIDDLGDGFCTFKESPYEEYKLKIEIENAADAGNSVVIKGNDQNGNSVTITSALVNPDITINQVFKGQLTMFQKPITHGTVNLYAVNNADPSQEELIGEYENSETTASYHRYAVPNEPSVDYVDVLCKIRYVPCVVDTDEVAVSNLGALKNMLISLRYEDEADLERSEMFFMKALQLLNGETKETRGGSRWTLNIDPSSMQFNNLWPGR
jgi:hypothetical protein